MGLVGHDRAKDELGQTLAAYNSPELLCWVNRSPGEFLNQVNRVLGWPYREGAGRSVGVICGDHHQQTER